MGLVCSVISLLATEHLECRAGCRREDCHYFAYNEEGGKYKAKGMCMCSYSDTSPEVCEEKTPEMSAPYTGAVIATVCFSALIVVLFSWHFYAACKEYSVVRSTLSKRHLRIIDCEEAEHVTHNPAHHHKYKQVHVQLV